MERVPAACVYCRRSVSHPLDWNTRGGLVGRSLCVMFDYELIRSGTWPAYDMRFGTTSRSIYAATLVVLEAL
jgi:hypothetical protein